MKTLVECPFCEARFPIDRDQLGIQGECVKCCGWFVFSGIKTRDKSDESKKRNDGKS